MRVTFKPTEESKKLVKDMKRSVKAFDRRVSKVLMELSKEIAKEVKSSIYKTSVPMAPLSPKTLEYKKSHGYPSRPLIATREYVRSIKASKMGSIVGVEADEVAFLHEEGTRYMPARPHWRIALMKVLSGFNLEWKLIMAIFAPPSSRKARKKSIEGED